MVNESLTTGVRAVAGLGANLGAGWDRGDLQKSATFCYGFSPALLGWCLAERADLGLWL